MAREVKDITSRKQWDTFVESHPEANFLQAWQWGEFHKSLGHDVVRRGLFDGKKLIGGCRRANRRLGRYGRGNNAA